jgi:hypothetical protein
MEKSKIEQVVNVSGALFVGSIGVTAGIVVGTVLQLFIQPNGNDSKNTILLREAVVYVPAIIGGIIGYNLAINP